MGLKLDFTGLDSIATEAARRAFTEDLKEASTEIRQPQETPLIQPQNSPQGQTIEGKALVNLNWEKEAHARELEVYREYQRNIAKSETLQSEILKGLKAGVDAHILLLKACKAISLMTSNTLFYSQTEADLKAIYGEGFLEPIPLERELDEVRGRIGNMERALEREGTETDGRERIQRAIKAHREREAHILGLLEKTELQKAI